MSSSSRDRYYGSHILRVLLLLLQIMSTCLGHLNGDDSGQEKKLYIVYMGSSSSFKSMDYKVDAHVTLLSDAVGSLDAAKESIVHSYNHFNAFGAKLTPDEATQLQGSPNVISVFPNQYGRLHTTASWDFLGFPQNVRRNLKFERDVVVGVIDTGITPDSESFNDEGFGPPPPLWKGSCGPFVNFSCNNKLIGARYFNLGGEYDSIDVRSPTDTIGHGTHTSSTVSGNLVHDANLLGLGNGTARGAVPSSRLAMYKACWGTLGLCADIDVLAAFDQAIEDGVHIISISLGFVEDDPHNYFNDSVAIGAFHAMKKGILTVAAAGNIGPFLGSVKNHAPWILTVAASGTSRQYRSKVLLGNGKILSGLGINTFSLKQKLYPLISGEDAGYVDSENRFREGPRFCTVGSLDPKRVRGKVVVCESPNRLPVDFFVSMAGGVGTILVDSTESLRYEDPADISGSPSTTVDSTTGGVIYNYINSTRSPSAMIYKTQEVNISAPFVSSFSSRGPSIGSRRVLKPDITAPGVNILAAFPPSLPITPLEGDHPRHSKYNIMSGTSMACPHVAGVAAYVKSFHPDWSPAAIKSAILTTATPMSPHINKEAEFAYGAGQINPLKAVHPGLVFDMHEPSYIKFLCQEGYSSKEIRIISGTKMHCPRFRPKGYDVLNYPTMQLSINTTNPKPVIAVFRRTVTNVGLKNSIYKVTTEAPKNVKMRVKPKKLVFTKKHEKLGFTVVVKLGKWVSHKEIEILSGSVTWTSSRHTVRSPVVISLQK